MKELNIRKVDRWQGKIIIENEIIGCCLPLDKLCIWKEDRILLNDSRCWICPYFKRGLVLDLALRTEYKEESTKHV